MQREFWRRAARLFVLFLMLGAAPALAADDYSDAPSSYGNPKHAIVADYRLGAQIDGEGAPLFSASANGDDNNGIDDEDGVAIPAIQRGTIASIPVSVSGGGGFLQVWIDWNGDGDWGDAGEQVAIDVQDGGTRDFDGAANGQILVRALVPANATTATTYTRFRWSSDNGLGQNGSAGDGEVEDYALTILAEGASPALAGCIGPSVSTHSFTTSPTDGTLSTGTATGTFNVAATNTGFGATLTTAGANGIQYDMQPGGIGAPDRFQYDYTVTPASGAAVSQIIICQSPYENAGGNNEPHEMTLSWPGGGTGIVYDPDNQISSHANGAVIASGARLIFANSVPNGPGTNGNGLAGPDRWAVIVNAPGTSAPFAVTLTSLGCQLSLPDNFCHLTNTGSTISGDRFREWISFDARLTTLSTALTTQKSSFVITNPVEMADHKSIPGATIRYCVIVTNPGPGLASQVDLSDPLPPQVTYVPNSLAIGTGCSAGLAAEDDDAVGPDEIDPYGASMTGATVTASINQLASGDSVALIFDVTLN